MKMGSQDSLLPIEPVEHFYRAGLWQQLRASCMPCTVCDILSHFGSGQSRTLNGCSLNNNQMVSCLLTQILSYGIRLRQNSSRQQQRHEGTPRLAGMQLDRHISYSGYDASLCSLRISYGKVKRRRHNAIDDDWPAQMLSTALARQAQKQKRPECGLGPSLVLPFEQRKVLQA